MTEFEKIYRDYFDDVFLYIKRLSGSEDIAEDITSEAFYRAMRSIKGFRGECDIRVWRRGGPGAAGGPPGRGAPESGY